MTTTHTRTLHIGVDLSGASARPAGGSPAGAVPRLPFDAARLADLVAIAERGALDLIAIDSTFRLVPERPSVLDAARVARRLGATTERIGLVPTIATASVAPQHIAQALAAIGAAGPGRVGWQVGTAQPGPESATAPSALIDRLRGTRVGPAAGSPGTTESVDLEDLGRAVGSVTDSWAQLAAEAGPGRRPASGRPGRPGRAGGRPNHVPVAPDARPHRESDPVVVVRVGGSDPQSAVDLEGEIALAGRHADVVRLVARDVDTAHARRSLVRAAAERAGRDPDDVRVLVDLGLVVAPSRASAEARTLLLADTAEALPGGVVAAVGTAFDAAALIASWFEADAVDGFVVRPASLRTDLVGLVDGVIPVLRESGVFRRGYPGATLRDTLALSARRARFAVPA